MPRLILAAALLAALLLPVFAGPAAAFPLSTCTLSLASTDADGAPLDTAQGGAPDSTVDDPFKVDWDGEVAYEGSTEVVIKNYTYHVEVFGVPTPLRGGDANDDENTDGSGTVSVGANAPFRVAGLYYVSGAYTGEGGSCSGSGWFQLLGSPIGTVPWIAGVAMAVLGALGIVAGFRGHLLTSLLGGLLLGVGSAVLLISHSVMPLAENTPLVAVIVGVILGFIAGIAGRRGRGGESEEAPPPAPAPPPDQAPPPDETTPPAEPLPEA
jgi:hypothetical protein